MTRWRGEVVSEQPQPAQWTSGYGRREPDVSGIVQALYSNSMMILAIAAFGSIAAFAVLKTMPPQFTASALIMLDSRNTLLDETQGVFNGLPIADTYIESEIELIRSDAIVHRVIEEEGLLADPEFAQDSMPKGIRRMIDNRASESDDGRAEAEELTNSVNLLQVSEAVRKRLDVERRGLSQGIEISFRSKSQVKSRDLANSFAASYVEDQLGNKMAASNRATSWLRGELTTLAKETQAAEAAVEQYRAKHTLVGEGDQGVSSQQLKLLNAQLAEAKADESEAQAMLSQMKEARVAGRSLLLMPEVGEKPTIMELRRQLNEAEREEAEMASRYNSARREEIPPYQDAYSKRRALEVALNREIGRVVGEIETRVTSTRAVARSLEGELRRLRGEAADVNEASIGLNELEREAQGKRQRYEALLAESNEADSVAASQTPHARIVSPAELPLSPSSPRKAAAFGAAIIFSLALGVFAALLRETFRRGVRSPEELAEAASARAIGLIPRGNSRNKSVRWAFNSVSRSTSTLYSEAVRSLRTELSLGAAPSRCEVVALTSPDMIRGKTALAASLARSIALTGAKTLLIDADLRRSDLMEKLCPNYKGPDLADALRGSTAHWRDAVLSRRDSHMELLAARRGRWNDAVYAGLTKRFKDMIAELRADYETIVINTPPVLDCPETRIIAAAADDILLCVQWDRTDRHAIAEAMDLLEESGKAPKPVIVHVSRHAYKHLKGNSALAPYSPPALHVLRA